MPFIRQLRDKRGYETTYVMHAYRPGQGPQRTRILYLFRSPAHLKFGRRPLDDEAREALEHTHPDVSFDWNALDREVSAGARPEFQRPRDRERPGRTARRPGAAGAAAPAPEPPRPAEDRTLLGRVLGADRAGTLRARHADVLQKIARRVRTPEDRDRLLERAQRHNPDDWPDEAAVLAGAAEVESRWERLLAELPPRRRGRRGGRRRDEVGPTAGEAPDSTIEGESEGADDAPAGSGIIDPRGGADRDEEPKDVQMAGDDPRAGGPDDGDRLGTGSAGPVPGDD